MNRKGEWDQNLPPKLTIEDSDEGRIPGAMKTRGKRKTDAPKQPLKIQKADANPDVEQCRKRPRILSQGMEKQGPSDTNDLGVISRRDQLVPGQETNSDRIALHLGKPCSKTLKTYQ